MNTKKLHISKVKDNIGYGNRVFVEGIVRRANKDGNYCEVEILDRVCGRSICRVTCHVEGVFTEV